MGPAELCGICFQSLVRSLFAVFRKIFLISFEQTGDIVADNIDFAANFFGLAGVKPAKPEVGVQTAPDTLKQLLIGFPGGGPNQLLISAETANQTVAGGQRTERARVYVGARD